MTSMHCHRDQVLKGIVTDRKDFYRQAFVSRQKSHLNCLPFRYDIEEFYGSMAYEELLRCREEKKKSGKKRHVVGDRYGKARRDEEAFQPTISDIVGARKQSSKVFPAFKSLFQGDHLGVEFALSAHGSLLEGYGLLNRHTKIQGKHPFPRGPLWEGLVIDDYFAVSQQASNIWRQELSEAERCLATATLAYEKNSVLGSPEKDVDGSVHFKIVGAEVGSRPKMRSRGQVLVGAPLDRRMSLAALSLKACRLPVVSRAIASRLAGALCADVSEVPHVYLQGALWFGGH